MRLMTTSLLQVLLLFMLNQHLSEARSKCECPGWCGHAGKAVGAVGVIVAAIYGGLQISLQWTQHKEQMAYQREHDCYAKCVGEWSPWSECTRLCGGGTMSRSREKTAPKYCDKIEGFSCKEELEQTVQCNPDCPHGGWPKSEGGCECPDGRKGKCCQGEVRCDYPGRPEHGQRDGILPAVYGTVVTYSCNEDYMMLNGKSEIHCLKNGEWSGKKPDCVALQCEKPSPPANGSIITDAPSYFSNQEIWYTCDEGHVMVGPKIRRCSKFNQEASWSEFSPICVETSCADPGYPLNGEIDGRDFSLDGTIQITCKPGYGLEGSTERRCLESGRWTGHETKCIPISCEPPVVPLHGRILPEKPKYIFGAYVTIRCDSGYQLKGMQKLRCIQNDETVINDGGGIWNEETPTCEAVRCGDPGIPQHGTKDGSLFMYPHYVTFTCIAGYTLKGSAKIHCGSTGTWSPSIPSCVACPKSTYKNNTSLDSPCEACPENTHTLTAASTSEDQCSCNHGFKFDSKGICQEIRCRPLSAPTNGLITSCDNILDSICQITCKDGFVMKSGDGERRCLEDGSWSGTDAACQACPINTYKEDEGICVPCPKYSHTNEVAQSKESCICDDGFKKGEGSACIDINECEENGGRGPCSEICTNFNGGYTCDCDIPGHVTNPVDNHECISNNTCRNLTQKDAPKHGGLVCHWYHDENSQICATRCNPGYEFPDRVNSYEYCGPNTGYRWSHEVNDEEINDCVREFYAEIRLEADSFYLTRNCTQLTEAEQLEVKQNLADLLTEEEACSEWNAGVCDVEDIEIICGETNRRRRRSVDGVYAEEEEEADQVTIQKNIRRQKFQEFYADVSFEADFFFLTRWCTHLIEFVQVQNHMTAFLTKEKVFVKQNMLKARICDTRVCNVKNVKIICGETKGRREGVDSIEEEKEPVKVTIQMNIRSQELHNSSSLLDCDKICPFLNIPMVRCSSLCVRTYTRYLKAAALYSKRLLETLETSAIDFVAGGMHFKALGVSTKDPIMECETGMLSENNLCVPCSKGSYHDSEKNECTGCSPGFYQPLERQTYCLPCPTGTFNNRTRATSCDECTSGAYGVLYIYSLIHSGAEGATYDIHWFNIYLFYLHLASLIFHCYKYGTFNFGTINFGTFTRIIFSSIPVLFFLSLYLLFSSPFFSSLFSSVLSSFLVSIVISSLISIHLYQWRIGAYHRYWQRIWDFADKMF